MGKVMQFLKNWMLVISIIIGASAYVIYYNIPALHSYGPFFEGFAKRIQPVLLFSMLFLSFCKISPRDFKPHRWQIKGLAIQGLSFILLALIIVWSSKADGTFAEWLRNAKIPIETAMLCLICPTATACAVVTNKLGGSMAQVVTYTVLVNLLVSILIPLIVPLIYPQGHLSFLSAFLKILSKVFPLLIMPCICAWLLRIFLPKVHRWFTGLTNLAFYIWAVSLSLAILMSTKAIVRSGGSVTLLSTMAAIALLCCIFQFHIGKKIGARYSPELKISAGQALGQKNTVFAIWIGYTFMDPIVSVTGGFYSIWHNLFNSWQLYLKRKSAEPRQPLQ